MYKFKTKEDFVKSYRKYEALHGREVSDLDADRVYNRYLKIAKETW
jgi:hypothetical protein